MRVIDFPTWPCVCGALPGIPCKPDAHKGTCNMLEYIELGPTPAEESCAQLGADDYDERVKIEGRAYIAQLIRQFGTPPTGVSLRLKAFPHDFGSYHEIVVQFDDNDEAASDWAYNVEAHTPGEWDDEARDAITRPAADTVGALNLPT